MAEKTQSEQQLTSCVPADHRLLSTSGPYWPGKQKTSRKAETVTFKK